jgi:hypothetical protein
MRSPAAAIAWQLRQRHRWGLLALLATLLALGAIRVAVLWPGAPLELHAVTFALLMPVPLSGGFFYLLAVFTFGMSGDLAARDSMYPSRMLTLPVSSAALAGWPMLYGCVSVALLWLALRVVGTPPPGFEVPTYWPALFAASLLAWAQALTWMPYPARGLRIVAMIALLVAIDVVAFMALENQASETTMVLLLAPLMPLAYLAAVSALRRARRGDVSDWRPRQRLAPALTPAAALRPFTTAARAQLWFEWRRYGGSLPLLVAIVLPVELSLLFLFREAPVIVVEIVVAALLLPPFLAIFVAATAGKSSTGATATYGISAFLATRPVADRFLVVAKWRTALASALAAWLIVAVALPLALTWAEAWEPVTTIARHASDAVGRERAVTLGALVVVLLIGATWKQLVQGFYIAMSGRDWAVKGTAFAALALVGVGVLALGWILDSRHRIAVAWSVIPWLMVALVVVKLFLAVRVMHQGTARGLFTRRQLVVGALAWDICVLALYGVLAFLLPAILFRRHLLLVFAMLVVPFVRLAAAPLAVARNRHR